MAENKNHLTLALAGLTLALGGSFAEAKDRLPLPDTAWDGGALSAEALGRGNTIASNRSDPAAGSENPAVLTDSTIQAAYATGLVDTHSQLPDNITQASDPLAGRVLQYLSIEGEKGVVYYEPLGRIHETQKLANGTDTQDVDFSANAIGFAGAEKWGPGSIGLSLAYLWSASNVVEHVAGLPDKSNFDTQDGLRMNIGLRYPTGPVMWGGLIQNAPGMLWGKDYKREMLPVKVRVGNTYRVVSGFLLSIDWERRFYHEGSNADNYIYLGTEINLSKKAIFRLGMFGNDINKPDKRHSTAGLTLIADMGAQITYALDSFEQDSESVKKSVISLVLPFESSSETVSYR